VHRIMRAGLVGHDVGPHATRLHPARQFGEDIGGIADQPHRFRLARFRPALDHRQRLVEVMGDLVDIARPLAELGAAFVAFHGEAARPGKDGGQRLRAAHATQAGRQDPPARKLAVIMLPPGLGKGLVGALYDALADHKREQKESPMIRYPDDGSTDLVLCALWCALWVLPAPVASAAPPPELKKIYGLLDRWRADEADKLLAPMVKYRPSSNDRSRVGRKG